MNSSPSPNIEGVRSRFAMCFVLQGFGPVQVPKWGPSQPVLVPSCPRPFQDGAWTAETDFEVGNFRNISTSSSPKKAIWGPQTPSPRKCRETPETSGFPSNGYRSAEKRPIQRISRKFFLGIPNRHFGMIFLGG